MFGVMFVLTVGVCCVVLAVLAHRWMTHREVMRHGYPDPPSVHQHYTTYESHNHYYVEEDDDGEWWKKGQRDS